MDLQDGDYAGVDVVRLGRLGVVDGDGEPASWNAEDGRLVEKVGKLFRIQRRARDQQLQIRPEATDILNQSCNQLQKQNNIIFIFGIPET